MPIVLVVDDSAVDRRLVGGLLARSSNLQVEYAADGREAMEKIRRAPPNLVITDLVMPELNGLELVSEIRRDFPQVPVVLMTGKGSEDIAMQALRHGASSYVPKGSLNQLLLETVESVLAANQEKRVQQHLMSRVSQIEMTFDLENDSSLIPPLIAHLQDLASQVGLCESAETVRIAIALEEALRNAMFHGNLEISSEAREGDSNLYRELLASRLGNEPYCSRRLQVKVRLTPNEGRFTIRDQGPGFDPTTLPDPTDPENLDRACGRGLLLMKTFMDDVAYNPTGNEVTMIKRAAG